MQGTSRLGASTRLDLYGYLSILLIDSLFCDLTTSLRMVLRGSKHGGRILLEYASPNRTSCNHERYDIRSSQLF